MEWKTQRYEGSVGVDGRWVVNRSEAEARIEAAERDRQALDRDYDRLCATLAAVRRLCEDDPSHLSAEIRGVLDGEGGEVSENQIDGTPFHVRSHRLWGEQLVVTPLSPTDGEWNAHLVKWGVELAKELGLSVNIPEGEWPLDGKGEKCPTCGGTDREGGTVATSGPDEFGNYETDDCEECS